MKIHLRLPLFLLFVFFSLSLSAQDIHLSHIHASPTVLNPAMTGLYKGDLRLIANTKSQWQSVTNGYKTVVGSADMKVAVRENGDVIGGGIQLFSDRAGDLDFTTRSVSLSTSYLKSLDNSGLNMLAVGLQGGFVNNSVDFSKIVAFDMEPAIAEGINNQVGYFDISGGISWFYGFNHNHSIHIGLSAFHLNKPDVSILRDNSTDAGVALYRRFVIHGGSDFRLGRKSFLKPSFMISNQGPHREFTVGTFWKYLTFKRYSNNPGAALYVGGWLRWHFEKNFSGTDAIIAAVRLDLEDLFFTFSFDLNISTLSNVSYGRGGPELSIVKILHFNRSSKRAHKVECPDF
ncbi:MAG: PorP/SprF family type IX secretion system membrane protein [Bacteroidota bacterium]